MDTSARCWLVVVAVAPLVALLSLWGLWTFHGYRRQWRTVDLFLVACLAQEFIDSLFLFGHAMLNLTLPTVAPVCVFFGWAALAVRTFQITTLASLVLDRAMTVKWPYRYRLSVRRNQVRYHIVVIATIAVLVGVASVFANSTDDGGRMADDKDPGVTLQPPTCFLLPFTTDKKFVLFVIVLHGLLAVLSILCLIHVQAKLCSSMQSTPFPSLAVTVQPPSSVTHIRVTHPLPSSYLMMESPTTTLAPPASSTTLSNGTTWSMSAPIGRSSFSLKRDSSRISRDLRWKVVIAVTITCILVNHIPYLVMVVLARFVTIVPPLWLESGSIYLALVEGLLLPAILWGIDPTYRAAISQTFVRIAKKGMSPKTSYMGTEAGDETTSRHSSLPHLEPSSAYSSVNGFVCSDTLDKKVLLTNDSKWSTMDDVKKNSYLNVTSLYSNKNSIDGDKEPTKPDSRRPMTIEPVYCDPTEMVLGHSNATEEHIYATLSERYACSTISDGDADLDRMAPLVRDYDEDDDDADNSSVTTSASDDFEFHHTRPLFCQGLHDSHQSPVISRSLLVQQSVLTQKSPQSVERSSATPSRASTLSVKSVDNPQEHVELSTATPLQRSGMVDHLNHQNHHLSPVVMKAILASGTLSRSRRAASLSMNDIDILAQLDDDDTEEVIYVLSGKSESTISLYKFNNGSGSDEGTLDRPLVHYTKCLPTQPDTPRSNHPGKGSPRCRPPPGSPRHRSEPCDWETVGGHVFLTSGASNGDGTATVTGFGGTTKRLYHRNPMLIRNRLYKSHATPTQGYGLNNWKYRASVYSRPDFPWRKSLARPFQVPAVSKSRPPLGHDRLRCPSPVKHFGGRVFSPSAFHLSSSNYELRTKDGMTSYQKKFVSDFL